MNDLGIDRVVNVPVREVSSSAFRVVRLLIPSGERTYLEKDHRMVRASSE
jgi:hypothetical protein